MAGPVRLSLIVLQGSEDGYEFNFRLVRCNSPRLFLASPRSGGGSFRQVFPPTIAGFGVNAGTVDLGTYPAVSGLSPVSVEAVCLIGSLLCWAFQTSSRRTRRFSVTGPLIVSYVSAPRVSRCSQRRWLVIISLVTMSGSCLCRRNINLALAGVPNCPANSLTL